MGGVWTTKATKRDEKAQKLAALYLHEYEVVR